MATRVFFCTEDGSQRWYRVHLTKDRRKTRCGRFLQPPGCPPGQARRWSFEPPSTSHPMHDCERCKNLINTDNDEGLPTMWRTMDPVTRQYKLIPIIEMTDSHLLAAISYCERKASEFGRITRLDVIETAARLWPGYNALRAEADRRFGPPRATEAAIETIKRRAIDP